MASEGAKPNPSDLAALEHAFASDPASSAYKDLAEAYLALGRYMEAMVVCKRGVKEHAGEPEARVLLARVYADQGKDRKAVGELQSALETAPDDRGANLLLAGILLNQGEMETGTAHLKKAADAAPGDPEVEEALRRWGIDYSPAAAAPPPAPEPPPAPAPAPPPGTPEVDAVAHAAPRANGAAGHAAPDGPPVMTGAPAPQAAPPVMAGAPVPQAAPPPAAAPPAQGQPPHVSPGPPPGYSAPTPGHTAPTPGYTPPPPRAPVRTATRDPDPDLYDDDIPLEHRPRSRGAFLSTVAVVVLGVLGLGGYAVWYSHKADQDRQISKLLKTAQDEISHDSYASYRAAAKTCDKILDLDPDQFAAHAYLAYINTLRWGEYGEGETYKQRAQQHLTAAKAQHRDHSHLIAAEAYYAFFSGDSGSAIHQLQLVLKRKDVASSMLSSSLGLMLMWSGDLHGAAKALLAAQQLAPGEPRILYALGELARRQGDEDRAMNYFDQALRFDPHHVDSLLSKALLILDSDRGQPKVAAPLVDKVLAMPAEQVSPKQLAMAHFAKAELLYAEKKDAAAKAEQSRALTLQPGNPDIQLMIGRRLARAGRFAQATEHVQKAIGIDPKRAGFYVELAKVLLAQKGKAPDAVAALEKARKTLPDNAGLLVLLGDAHAGAGNIPAALTAYQKAIAMKKGSGGFPEAQLAIGELYRGKKDYAKAVPALNKAVDAYKNAFDALGEAKATVDLARIAMAQGDMGKAQELLKQAVKIDEGYADSYYFLGRTYMGNRHTRRIAKQLFAAYLKLAPEGDYAGAVHGLIRHL